MILKPPLPRLRRSHPLTNGLVFTAPFYEGSGGILHDISGRDNHGTLTNMDPNTDWVGSPHGWALDFDGTDDFVDTNTTQVGGVSLFASNSQEWTVFTNARLNGNNGNIIAKSGSVTASATFRLLVNSSNELAVLLRGTTTVVKTSATGTTWRSIAVTWDKTTAKGFWQGLPGVTLGVGAAVEETTQRIIFAARTNGTGAPLACGIASVLIYNRALSASEIAELYFNPAVIYEPPKKYWLFGSSASPQILSPDPAEYDWTALDPTLTPGAVTLSPATAEYDWTVNDPAISAGAVTLSPDPAIFTWTANNPTITAGGVAISPDAAEFEWVANDAGITVEGDTTLFPEPAVWNWYAQSPSIEAIECEPLLGCRLSFFTYSIDAGIQPEPGDDCEVLSGCRLSFFTYSIEE